MGTASAWPPQDLKTGITHILHPFGPRSSTPLVQHPVAPGPTILATNVIAIAPCRYRFLYAGLFYLLQNLLRLFADHWFRVIEQFLKVGYSLLRLEARNCGQRSRYDVLILQQLNRYI